MSRIPSPFHRIDTAQPGISSLLLPGLTSSPPPAKPAEPPLRARERARHTPCTLYTGTHISTAHCVGTHQQSCRSLPQGGTNLCRNRIPSTIPFARQAPDLTRLTFLFVQRSSAKIIWFAGIVLSFAKISGIISVSPRSPFACAGPNQRGSRRPLHQQSCRSLHTRKRVPGSQKLAGPRVSTLRSGTPGTTHRHVTGPQVVPQYSLQEQPSVHAIPISRRFSPATQSLQTYLPLKGSCSCAPTNKSLQKNILTRFFFPDSHNHIGESGLIGHRHGRNVSDVDELRVLADRRPKLHRNSRFAGYPRATTIGKEHPAMAWVVNVGGRTAKQITGHPLVGHGHYNHAADRPRENNCKQNKQLGIVKIL